MERLIEQAADHLRDILREAIRLAPTEKAIVIFDTQSPLADILTEAYREAVPSGAFVEFEKLTPLEIFQRIDACTAGDLVVMIQSTNFRLDEFRIRIELFKRGLKTIEHMHLDRMPGSQYGTYIDALAYDPSYYRPLGRALASRLDGARTMTVECAGTTLVYAGPNETTKLNIGDYTGMKNVGGTYPIGEVFTEPKDLRAVNGEVRIFAYAGDDHLVKIVPPFTAQITDGILTAPDGPADFRAILEKIREDEEVLVREFGLGLNRAMGKQRPVNDITAFERQSGLHLSLGAKHAMYVKPGLGRKQGRYHVDVFVDAERIRIDGDTIFEGGNFTVPTG